MSAVMSHCVSGAGAKTGSTPLLSGAPALKHYRRSTTNKAPRKRTFLVTMTKFDQRCVASSAFANNVAMLSTRSFCYDDTPSAFGGDNGNNGRFGGNNGGNNNNGGQGGFGDSAPRLPAMLFGQALLGALALTVAVAAFPAHSTAASSLVGTSSAAASARPRSKVMHVATKDGTLVVPLPANSEAKARAGPFARSKIVDAPIQLTGREAAILDGRQYRVRESMIVH